MQPLHFEKTTAALVVIDLQKGIVGRTVAPHPSQMVVKNAALLADAFRAHGQPVFLVRVTPSPDGRDALRPLADISLPAWTPAPDWADIVPEMKQSASDLIITKHQWGAFYGTELDLQLRRRGVTTLVLCGIATHIGVESTARCAYEYGYQQIFAEDAMAAMSAEEHAFPVANIFPRIGRVRSTQDILDALQG